MVIYLMPFFSPTFLPVCCHCLLQKRCKAQVLLEKVFEYLELVEKDYFGLQFADVGPPPESVIAMVNRVHSVLTALPDLPRSQ